VTAEEQVAEMYVALARSWGPQHWWPAQSPFEVIVGAYLTQNTSWRNVELALDRLREAGILNLQGIRGVPVRRLESLIRSSGYFRQKTRRLKGFIEFLDREYGGSLTRMFAQPTVRLREQLLALNGVGPETADSILLYAGQHPVFVVDAYTKRIAARHSICPASAAYDDVQRFFSSGLAIVPHAPLAPLANPGGAFHPPSRMSQARRSPLTQVFNEMHGLLVGVGKTHCFKAIPRCEGCPLEMLLPKP
jgi:endonuclease-3 related protein